MYVGVKYARNRRIPYILTQDSTYIYQSHTPDIHDLEFKWCVTHLYLENFKYSLSVLRVQIPGRTQSPQNLPIFVAIILNTVVDL